MINKEIKCQKCGFKSFKIIQEYNPDTTDQYMHVDYKCLKCNNVFAGKTTSSFYIKTQKELSNL